MAGGPTMDKERRCRSGTRVVACDRCHLEVSVTSKNGGVQLSYNFGQWKKTCCCAERPGPAYCCSFFALEDIFQELRRPPGE